MPRKWGFQWIASQCEPGMIISRRKKMMRRRRIRLTRKGFECKSSSTEVKTEILAEIGRHVMKAKLASQERLLVWLWRFCLFSRL